MKFKSLQFKSFRPDAAFTRFVLALSAGLLFACAHVSIEAQQTPNLTPITPPANKQQTPTPSRKSSKSIPQTAEEAARLNRLQETLKVEETQHHQLTASMLQDILKTRETLQQQLATAMQEEKSLQKRLDTLTQEAGTEQNRADPSRRLKNILQLQETQAKLTDKLVFIGKQKQLLEQNASTGDSLYSALTQNHPGVVIPAPKLDAGSRSLLFTPADKAKLVKRNLLFTPEDQKRVKFLPKSDERTTKP